MSLSTEGRIPRVRSVLAARNLDALIVTNKSNIRYLSGFTGSNGTVVVTVDGASLITDSRYTERAGEELARVRVETGEDIAVITSPGAGHKALRRQVEDASDVGLEADDLSWSAATALQELLGTDRVRSTVGVVEELRELKSPAEVELMAQAATIADRALAEVISGGLAGRTELDVQRSLDGTCLRFGADGASFDTIVASGPNASRPHHEAGKRTIEAGDLVIIDFGAEVGGYRSDMTRSFVIGQPNPQQTRMLDAVEEAQRAGVALADVGVPTANIDAECRRVLESHDLVEYFVHGTGHGVGLDIHEAPSVSSTSTATLARGHVITVEPGVYLPGIGGVRWEDTVAITDNGSRTLTQSPKQPVLDA